MPNKGLLLNLRPNNGNTEVGMFLNNSGMGLPIPVRANDVTILFSGNTNDNNYGIMVQDSSNRKFIIADNDPTDFNTVVVTLMDTQIDFNAIRNKYL